MIRSVEIVHLLHHGKRGLLARAMSLRRQSRPLQLACRRPLLRRGSKKRAVAGCELLLAVAWLTGHATAAAPLTALLLAVYALAMALNLLRGRVYIGCGCSLGGSPASDTPLSWWLVMRNLLLSGLALLGAVPTTGRTLVTHDRLTVVLATLACIILFAGASQLLKNRAGMAAWRRPRD